MLPHLNHRALLPLHLSNRTRLLIFAPHPDDELVGTGALLLAAQRGRAHTAVVVLSDGNGPSATRMLHQWSTSASLGKKRIHESASGLARLKVAARQYFLHLDDGKILDRYVRERQWTGSIEAQLSPIVRRERPTMMVFPTPSDSHLDHRATALLGLVLSALLSHPPQRLGYLVHYGFWPLVPMVEMRPPSNLDHAYRWLSVSLHPSETQRLRTALAAHRSQLAVAALYLYRFAQGRGVVAVLGQRVQTRFTDQDPSLHFDHRFRVWASCKRPPAGRYVVRWYLGPHQFVTRSYKAACPWSTPKPPTSSILAAVALWMTPDGRHYALTVVSGRQETSRRPSRARTKVTSSA